MNFFFFYIYFINIALWSSWCLCLEGGKVSPEEKIIAKAKDTLEQSRQNQNPCKENLEFRPEN